MSAYRLILAGGGDENDSRLLDELFVQWLGPRPRLLFLPVALDVREHQEGYRGWLTQTFAALGVTDIDTWYSLAGHTAAELDAYSGIYLGGGNTFYMLDQVRRHGFDTAIRAYAASGRAVYGGSAGAILLCANIDSTAHLDEDPLGLADRSALDLLGGWSFWCHYKPAHHPIVAGYAARTGIPCVAVSERGGVVREGDSITAAGWDPALVFRGETETSLAPGQPL